MKHRLFLYPVLLTACVPTVGAQAGPEGPARPPTPISALLTQARSRVGTTPRVALVPESEAVLSAVESLEPAGDGRIPNYLRAMAAMPASIKLMAHLVRTVYFHGTLEPEVKLAMGLRIAQADASPYVAAHLNRLLGATDAGRRLAGALSSGNIGGLLPAETAALSYASTLGAGPRSLSDDEFHKVRAWYNDAQIVELTVVVAFTSYFTRFCEGLNLPVERWVLETSATAQPKGEGADRARIALLTDEEVALFQEMAERQRPAPKTDQSPGTARQSGGLGIGIANSQRAMARTPEHMRAWFDYWASARQSEVVSRADKLQVSFAVSMANGCRYCTVHQVVGLRRLGMDPAKLLAMKKDDAALTPREKTAVVFSRKLTRAPASVTDADYAALSKEFGAQGALEVLLQASCFNFMNRFTDGLRLPSEDEAVHIYQEVYGDGTYAGYRQEDARRTGDRAGRDQ